MTPLTLPGIGTLPDDGTGDTAQVGGAKIVAAIAALNTITAVLVGSAGAPITASGNAVQDSANFSIAYANAAAGDYSVSGYNNRGAAVIYIAPGKYTLNAALVMMDSSAPTRKIEGLIFKGGGKFATTIIYDPGTPGPMCQNFWWEFVGFEDMCIISNDATGTSDFLQSYKATGASINGCHFTNVAWQGTWRDIISLQGNNNNSEWRFRGCMWLSGSGRHILYTPNAASGGSDQFINFWFEQCACSWSSGDWVDMSTGGSIHLHQCDFGGHSPTVDTYMFNLRGNAHSRGMSNFEIIGFRTEHKTDHSLLLYSEWNVGTITGIAIDTSSQAPSRTNTAISYVKCVLSGAALVNIRWEQCQFLGTHTYTYDQNVYKGTNSIVYDGCTAIQQLSAAAFIVETGSGAAGGIPMVRFENSHPESTYNGTAGAQPKIIFDTDLNCQSNMGGLGRIRQASLVGPFTDLPGGAQTYWFQFPLNAILVGLIFDKDTTVGDANPYAYTIQTNEVTPTVIATFSGSNWNNAAHLDTYAPSTGFAGGLAAAGRLWFRMTSDAMRTIQVIDTQNRATSAGHGPRFFLDYRPG